MKFKNILTEAMIDTLPFNKVEKLILNLIHNTGFPITNLEEFIIGNANKYAVSVNMVTKLYLAYQDHSEFLFGDKGIEMPDNFDINNQMLLNVTKRVIYEYLEKHYEDKEVINRDNLSARVVFNEEVETMIEEELSPEIMWEYNIGDLGYEDIPAGALFIGPSFNNIKQGFDVINFGDNFGEWNHKYGKVKQYDVVDTGYVKNSYLEPPKNYSDEELKRYCDKWMSVAAKILGRNIPLFEEYADYLEHGENGVFEGYKKRK